MMYAGATFRAWLGYSGRVAGYGAPDRFDELRDVGRADGAAMAVSRAAIERAGLLDERLFALRRGRRLVAAHPRGRLRGRLRARRASCGTGARRSTRRRARRRRTSTTRRATRSPSPSATARCRAGCARCAAASSSATHLAQARVAPGPPRGRARPCSTAGATPRGRAGCASEKLAVDVLVRARRASHVNARRALEAARAPSSAGAASTSSTAAAIAAGRSGRRARAASPTTSGSDADVRARDRAAARHRLERRLAEALVQRREDERRRAPVQRRRARPPRRAPRDLDARPARRPAWPPPVSTSRSSGRSRRSERERLEQPLVVLVRPARAPGRAGTARARPPRPGVNSSWSMPRGIGAHARRVEPEQLDGAVADERADRDHAVGAAHRAVPGDARGTRAPRAGRASGRSRCCRSCSVTTRRLRATRGIRDRQRVVDDVRAGEPRRSGPAARSPSVIAASRFGSVRASTVLGRDLGRQPAARRRARPAAAARGSRASPPRASAAQQLADVGLAAAELARHEREERDPDHAGDRMSPAGDGVAPPRPARSLAGQVAHELGCRCRSARDPGRGRARSAGAANARAARGR